MDEEISIIDSNTRNQKIKDFFINNKKILATITIFLIFSILSFYIYQIYKDQNKEKISNRYNSAIIEHKNGDDSKIISEMKEIIEDKNSTYSPLALYYLIDENLIKDKMKLIIYLMFL